MKKAWYRLSTGQTVASNSPKIKPQQKRRWLRELANGQAVEFEVTEDYQALLREQSRLKKEVSRYESKYISLSETAIGDEEKYKLAAPDPLDGIIRHEESIERTAKLNAARETLTVRQAEIYDLLCKEKSATEIAEIFGVTKQSVNDIKQAIKKKFQEFF